MFPGLFGFSELAELGVRDEKLWVQLAKKQMLLRRVELYMASVLSQLKPEIINREMEDLDRQIYEIDHEDEIDELEKMAKLHLEKIREIKKAKRNI